MLTVAFALYALVTSRYIPSKQCDLGYLLYALRRGSFATRMTETMVVNLEIGFLTHRQG